MATGVYTDMKVYNEQYQSGIVEAIAQALTAFGPATMNTLLLETALSTGHYKYNAMFNRLGTLTERRPLTDAAQTPTTLTQIENISVKLNRRVKEIQMTGDSWRKIGKTPQEMSYIIGKMVGDDRVQEYLNTVIGALAYGLANQATNYLDVTAETTLTMTATNLNTGLAKMGDARSQVKFLIMHSKVYGDLIAQAISDKVYEEAGMVVYGGAPGTFGRPVLVTDSDNLVTTDGTNVAYYTLGLTEAAAVIEDSETTDVLFDQVGGRNNINYRFQEDYAYNLGLKGFQWDVTNGGVNPSDAAVKTGSNWDMVVTSYKNLGGICLFSR